MNGNPGAVVFKHDENDQLYVFVSGGNGNLQVRFWDVPAGIWQWDDRGGADRVSLGSPSAAHNLLNPSAPESSLLVFARGNDGALYEQDWDGTQWLSWALRGQPVWNVQVAGRPAAAAFQAAIGDEDNRLFQPDVLAFVWGDDNNLYRYSWQHERWSFQGAGPQVASDPATIVQPIGANIYIPHAYVIGDDGHLWVSSATDYAGQDYAWHDLSMRDGPAITRNIRPGLALLGLLRDADQLLRPALRAFVRGEDGHLWAHSWAGWNDASTGHWADLGIPPGAGSGVSESSPVVFNRDETDFTYTFHVADNGHLYQRRWDGADSVLWDDFGQPATDMHNILTGPDVGNDNHLHHCYWDGNFWRWNDLGADPQDT